MLEKIFDFTFRKFPAYFWEKPNIYRLLLFPVLLYFYLKEDDKKFILKLSNTQTNETDTKLSPNYLGS